MDCRMARSVVLSNKSSPFSSCYVTLRTPSMFDIAHETEFQAGWKAIFRLSSTLSLGYQRVSV